MKSHAVGRYLITTYRVRLAEPIIMDRPIVPKSRDAAAILRPIFETLDADQEHLVVLALDGRGYVNGFKAVTAGTLTANIASCREVFKAALFMGAARIIIAHNHPSGDPTPSPEDYAATTRLREAGRIMGIEVADHIVMGAISWKSCMRGDARATRPGAEPSGSRQTGRVRSERGTFARRMPASSENSSTSVARMRLARGSWQAVSSVGRGRSDHEAPQAPGHNR